MIAGTNRPKAGSDKAPDRPKRRVYTVQANLVTNESIDSKEPHIVSRMIQVPGDMTVDELHDYVLNALDCYDARIMAEFQFFNKKRMAGNSIVYWFDFDHD